MKEKKFTLKTKVGSWRVFVLLIAIMLLFSFLSTAITTNFYKVQCTDVSIDVRGYDRTFELWRPVNVDNNTRIPCIIISHGGSESSATDVSELQTIEFTYYYKSSNH